MERFKAFLRKTEQYTKTDMVYLVGQSGWLFLAQGVVFLSAFLLAWVFANFITPTDYGLYKYVVSFATLATLTSMLGFGISISRYVAQGNEISLPKLTKLQIRYGTIGAICLLLVSIYYLVKGNELLATLFAVSAIWVPFYESFGNFQSLLQGKRDFKTQTYLRIAQKIALTVGVIGVIIITNNILYITLSYFAILTLTQFIMYRYTIHKYPGKNDSDTPYKKIISYGKKVSFQSIFYVGANQLDKILLFKFLGPAQLAIYLFAIALPNELQNLAGNINSVAFPKLVNKTTWEFKIALIKKILLSVSLLTIPALSYILLAPFIFHTFFPAYIDSILLSQLYIGTIFFIPANVFWLYFYAIEHQKALWFGTFIVPATFIIGIIFFVPLFGLMGTLFAVYLRYIVELSLGLYFFFSNTKAN